MFQQNTPRIVKSLLAAATFAVSFPNSTVAQTETSIDLAPARDAGAAKPYTLVISAKEGVSLTSQTSVDQAGDKFRTVSGPGSQPVILPSGVQIFNSWPGRGND